MNIGERIKQRRKELGLSVEDVANKLNKNRATVYRYESNDIENLPISILEPLAKILETTPAYLMGWDKPKQTLIKVSDDEKQLLLNFKELNSLGKNKLLEYSNDLIETQKYTNINNTIKLPVKDDSKKKLEAIDESLKANKEPIEILGEVFENVAAHNDELTKEEKDELYKKALKAIIKDLK